jgi:hypothetical protein
MSDEMVHVPFGDDRAETATLLLEAAEKSKEHEQSVVTVDHFTNSFVVPKSVADAAGADTFDPDADFAKEVEAAKKAAETKAGQSGELLNVDGTEQDAADEPAPAKKAAAKKSASKK